MPKPKTQTPPQIQQPTPEQWRGRAVELALQSLQVFPAQTSNDDVFARARKIADFILDDARETPSPLTLPSHYRK